MAAKTTTTQAAAPKLTEGDVKARIAKAKANKGKPVAEVLDGEAPEATVTAPAATPAATTTEAPAKAKGKKKAAELTEEEVKANKAAALKAQVEKKKAEEKAAKAAERAAKDAEEAAKQVDNTATYKKAILDTAPKTKEAAEQIAEGLVSKREVMDKSRAEIGMDWLRLRQPINAEVASLLGTAAGQSRHYGVDNPANGFHLAGFENEGEAAVAMGYAEKKQVPDPKDRSKTITKYTMNVISQCVIGAKLHLSLLEATAGKKGIESVSHLVQGKIMRSNLDVVKAVVPLVVDGKSDDEILAKAESLVGAKPRKTKAVAAEKLTTDELFEKAAKQLRKVKTALLKLEPIAKAGAAWAKEALARKDLSVAKDNTLTELKADSVDVAVRTAEYLGLVLEGGEAAPQVDAGPVAEAAK
jgi:hypothetical protein